jgi:ATP-dependent DNA helicase RecG
MKRIFELMKSNELAPPSLKSDGGLFSLCLFHKPMYSSDEVLWLDQYSSFDLSPEEKAILLLGRKGAVISPKDIWDRLGIVDTERYRQLVHSLQQRGILQNKIAKPTAQKLARRQGISVRDVPRFIVALAKDVKLKTPSLEDELPKRKQDTSHPSDDSTRTLVARRRESQGNRTIFVRNLPPNSNTRDLISAFQSHGTIAYAHVPQAGSISRGYGFIEFDKAETAEELLKTMPSIYLGPNRLSLRRALPRIKS